MIVIRHLVTKKLEADFQRLVFVVENNEHEPIEGELLFELSWIMGTLLNVDCGVVKVSLGRRFTIDLDNRTANRFSKFKFVFGKFEGDGKRSKLNENLTDVVRKEGINVNKQLDKIVWY